MTTTIQKRDGSGHIQKGDVVRFISGAHKGNTGVVTDYPKAAGHYCIRLPNWTDVIERFDRLEIVCIGMEV